VLPFVRIVASFHSGKSRLCLLSATAASYFWTPFPLTLLQAALSIPLSSSRAMQIGLEDCPNGRQQGNRSIWCGRRGLPAGRNNFQAGSNETSTCRHARIVTQFSCQLRIPDPHVDWEPPSIRHSEFLTRQRRERGCLYCCWKGGGGG
jgi:hypothetical protein